MRIIDGNNLLHRLGEHNGLGMHPVRSLFNKFIHCQETTIIVWDGLKGNRRRKEIYPKYKYKRIPKSEGKLEYFELCKAILRFTPVIMVELESWEADDIIATLCHRYHEDHDVTIESNDGDFGQLNQMAKLPLVSEKWLTIAPDMVLTYKSTVGDGKDNIPGIPGFGDVTYQKMSQSDRDKLSTSLRTKDHGLFVKALRNCPKSVDKSEGGFQMALISYRLNSFILVPDEEITKGMIVGQANLAAAEIFMGEYLI